MSKLQKILSMLLVICIFTGSVSTISFAYHAEGMQSGSRNARQTVEYATSTAPLYDDSSIFEKETILETLTTNEAAVSFGNIIDDNTRSSKSTSNTLSTIEDLFGCDFEISTAYHILDNVTQNDYIRYIGEDRTEISFSEEEGIFKISTIYNEESTTKNRKFSAEELQKSCADLMPKLYSLFNIKEEYLLTETYDFDQDYLFFTFEKEMKSGITNPFQSINVVQNKNTLNFTIAVKFDRSPNAITPKISAVDAISVANEYTAEGITLNSAELTYVSDAVYNSKIYQCDDVCYLVYKISSADSNLFIYIDALSGNYISRDWMMLETGYTVAISESNNPDADNYNSNMDNMTSAEIAQYNSWRYQKRVWAASAMARLGYSVTSASFSTSALITSVRNYLQALTNEYAFYFTGHGSETALGFKRSGIERITIDDVAGNWHFVFLDACKTAVDTRWADAFRINGYSNRAYLGWNGNIAWDAGYQFAQEFWPLINGTNTVRQAAVDAAALVPGSGTTPIRFYGDTSYTGEAWS